MQRPGRSCRGDGALDLLSAISQHRPRFVALLGRNARLTMRPKNVPAGDRYVYFSPEMESLLGHSQVSTTLDIYTHAFDKQKKAASEVLQENLEI